MDIKEKQFHQNEKLNENQKVEQVIDLDMIDQEFDMFLEERDDFDKFVKEQRSKDIDLDVLSNHIKSLAEEKSINTLEISLKEEGEDNE